MLLEQSRNLAGVNIHIHSAVGRIGAGSRHQADCSAAGAEELGPGEYQHVLNGQGPSLGYTLDRRIVGQGEMGLDHHCSIVIILRIVLKHLGLGLGSGCPGHTVCTVNVLGDEVNPVTQLRFQRIQEFEVWFFFTGFNDCVGEF